MFFGLVYETTIIMRWGGSILFGNACRCDPDLFSDICGYLRDENGSLQHSFFVGDVGTVSVKHEFQFFRLMEFTQQIALTDRVNHISNRQMIDDR